MPNELYRQGVHLIGGVLTAVAAFLLPQTLFLWLWGIIIFGWLIIILFFVDHFSWLFSMLERQNASFTGKGALFFGIGVFAAAALFWNQAGWAVLALAIPDSLATLSGKLFHSPKLPYNHHKSLLGSAAFFLAAVIILSVGFPFIACVLIAFLLAALESFDYKDIPFLDDNLVIPIVTAYLLHFL